MAPGRRSKPSRVAAVDALRGVIMALMAIDHIRDFFHAGAMNFSPTNFAFTTPAIFLTRWITHFCAPVFAFTAGMGACFWLDRGHTRAQLSRFLATRGIWLIFLELAVMQFAYYFRLNPADPVLLLVLWSLGASMVVLAALIHLPFRLLAALSLATIALHNLLDPIRDGAVWTVLHRPGAFPFAGRIVAVPYSLLPWLAVVTAGFCCGRLYRLDPPTRARLLRRIGLAATLAFFVLRAINRYGDPAPWTAQKSPALTALSFLNCTKYPPSLDFLLMTLGPALLALAWLDRRSPRWTAPAVTLGRAPLFFFVVHFYVLHALAVAFAYVRYGRAAAAFEWGPPPSMGAPRAAFPPDYGYDLWVVYAVWIVVLLATYPLCRRWAAWKATGRHWWLSYL